MQDGGGIPMNYTKIREITTFDKIVFAFYSGGIQPSFSVPVVFNAPVLDFWWRRPLTFRIYLRESGQRTVVFLSFSHNFSF